MTENKTNKLFSLTQDIVFKSFFSRDKAVLHSLLKSFLPLSDEISNITITNPEERDKQAQKQNSQNRLDLPQGASPSDKPDQKQKNKTDFQTNKAGFRDKQTHKKESCKERLESSLPENQNLSNDESFSQNQTNSPESQSALESSFSQTTLLPDILGKKHFVLDLIVELKSKKTINIEMQSALHKGFLKRILLYWARLHSQSLNKGEGYSSITPTYSLIFTKSPCLSGDIKEFVSSFSIKRDRKPFVLLNEDLKIVIVELSKLNKVCFEELIDLQEKWCYFLRESSALREEDRRLLLKDREMGKALKHLEELSRDKELFYKALSRENSEIAFDLNKQGWIEEGREKGRKEGRETNKKSIALKMLKEGLDKAFISKITSLSEAEIIKLKNQITAQSQLKR